MRPTSLSGEGSGWGDFTEYSLPEMDRYGIDMQVLSVPSPGLQVQLNPATAFRDARQANDMLTATIADHPPRFAGLAALPLPDPANGRRRAGPSCGSVRPAGALVNDHRWPLPGRATV